MVRACSASDVGTMSLTLSLAAIGSPLRRRDAEDKRMSGARGGSGALRSVRLVRGGGRGNMRCPTSGTSHDDIFIAFSAAQRLCGASHNSLPNGIRQRKDRQI